MKDDITGIISLLLDLKETIDFKKAELDTLEKEYRKLSDEVGMVLTEQGIEMIKVKGSVVKLVRKYSPKILDMDVFYKLLSSHMPEDVDRFRVKVAVSVPFKQKENIYKYQDFLSEFDADVKGEIHWKTLLRIVNVLENKEDVNNDDRFIAYDKGETLTVEIDK